MAARACVFLLTFLICSHLNSEVPLELVVWNVGQGQWAVLREDSVCWHFDMGGEFAPWRAIHQFCHGRENAVSLSHWDEDHVGFLGRASGMFAQICILHRPVGEASERKEQMLSRLPDCSRPSPFLSWVNPEGRTANDKSWVHLYRGILAPGDSPKKQERRWLKVIDGPARVLILGHHGSRTSTSDEMLFKYKDLRLAISSARFVRYKHPHTETVNKLRLRRIPLLRTEEWGNIHVFL